MDKIFLRIIGGVVLLVIVIMATPTHAQTVVTNLCDKDQCTEAHKIGDVVTLTAEPDAGWYFSGWLSTEAGCVGTGECIIKITEVRSYPAYAVFTENPTETLTVFVFGKEGWVTSAPAGLDCKSGQTCTAKFPRGAKIALVATGNPFTWRGLSCSGTGPCYTTMTKSKTLNVRFR